MLDNTVVSSFLYLIPVLWVSPVGPYTLACWEAFHYPCQLISLCWVSGFLMQIPFSIEIFLGSDPCRG